MKTKFNRIYVEITNNCNLNCDFCPKNNRTKQFMSVANFEQCLKQIDNLTNNIYLHVMGEPLLHPMLEEILKTAKQYGKNINLTTNGTLLSKNVEILKKGYLRKLTISLHSFEANKSLASLEQYLSEVVSTVKQITSTTNTIVEFRLWNKDENNLSAKNSLNNKIIDFIAKSFNAQLNIDELQNNNTLAPNIFLGFDNKFTWPEESNKNLATEHKFCYALRTHFAILVDGIVVPCCLDNNASMPLGNIFNQNISDILNSEKATRIYQNFSNRIATEPLCKQCEYAKRFDK